MKHKVAYEDMYQNTRILLEKLGGARCAHSSLQLILCSLHKASNWPATNALHSEVVINTLSFVLALPGLVIFSSEPVDLIKMGNQK